MTWENLHEEILSEFVESGRLSTDLAFDVMSGMVAIKSELAKEHRATYYAKKRLDPKFRAKNAARVLEQQRAKGVKPHKKMSPDGRRGRAEQRRAERAA